MGSPERDDDTTTLVNGEARAESAGEREWILIAMSGNSIGRTFPLDLRRPLILIGRDDASDVQVLDSEISRRHAAIRYEGEEGGLILVDLNSRNGTSVNGVRVEKQAVIDVGDKIQLGASTLLRVSLSTEPEASYAVQMYQAALRDGLTGAFNRRYFDDRVVTELAFAKRHTDPLALLLIDIDHFKRVNDVFGHPAGDAVLEHFVRLLEGEVRTEDVVARYGGEEFAVLCRDTSPEQALVLAERLRATIQATAFTHDDNEIPITASIGIANIAGHANIDSEALVSAADKALYAAKSGGRNQCQADR